MIKRNQMQEFFLKKDISECRIIKKYPKKIKIIINRIYLHLKAFYNPVFLRHDLKRHFFHLDFIQKFCCKE